ncbi:MAG: histidine phosphatase family protein [Gammaproteobacteria bacterium]
MRLHLIRHGETDWNAMRRVQGQMESRLSEQGRQQASQLAVVLNGLPISRVYCSSSLRTRETAHILFSESAVEISYHDELREIYLGPWEGNLYDELAEQDPDQYNFFWHQPDRFSLPGAETFKQLQQRGLSALAEILPAEVHEEVAIVSHGALIKSVLCHFEGRHLSRLWEPPRMPNCAHSILELETSGAGRIIRYGGIDYEAFLNSGSNQGTSA